MGFYRKNIFADKVFYHIYPLGLSNAPRNNDFCRAAGNTFEILAGDLDRIKSLGCNALYIGPVFESTKHGYDTIDYFYIDRRLGNNEKFRDFCKTAHEKGFSVVLDAVLNHTGRDFFAFRDLIQNGRNSVYKDWYLNLCFERNSCYGDRFDYEGWAGCMDLVKFNLKNEEVQNHLLSAVKFWIEEFGIDGLRLDAADVMEKSFLDRLGNFCRQLKPDFFLVGEVVHGDYNNWARDGRIDSVTNYQIYTALWESLNQRNFFNLAYNLNREFGSENGLYKYAPLYNFLDNHDVNRVGSVLNNPQKQLYLVYGLLFAIPGIPSIYYGSEYGIRGVRNNDGDYQLRPSLPPFNAIPDFARPYFDSGFLTGAIGAFARVRANSAALKEGDYREEFVTNCQFGFTRNWIGADGNKDGVLVLCNCDEKEFFPGEKIKTPSNKNQRYRDLLSGQELDFNQLKYLKIPGNDIKFLQIL